MDDLETAPPIIIERPVPPKEDYSKLSIKELKERLATADVNTAGATEKDDLVRLLTKARAQAESVKAMLVATTKWQEVPKGVSVPPGCEVKFNMTTGKNYARLAPPAES